MIEITNAELNRIAKTLLENSDRNPSEEDKYYVYMLATKKEKEIIPFYIGKGTGTRVFAHENDAENVIKAIEEANEEPLNSDISEKIKKITNNKENIEKYIIKWGLSSDEAFMCESALLNMYDCLYPDTLTNVANGHASEKEKNSRVHTTRAYEISEFLKEVCIEEINYEDSLLINIPVAFIKITDSLAQYDKDKSYENKLIDYDQYVYESAQGYWNLSFDRACKAKYVVALQNNIIRGIYRINEWKVVKELREGPHAPSYPLETRKSENVQEDTKFLKKIGFIKKDDDLMTDDEIDELNKLRNQLLNKMIKERKSNGKSDEKDWFNEQKSTYNYEFVKGNVTVKEKLKY